VAVAGDLHGAVEQHRIGVGLGAAVVEHRGEVGAAAEPLAGGYHHAGVHVHRRHMRIGRVGDQRNAGGPEPGSSSAPGIWARNSGENSPWTVEVWTPTFSNSRPFMIDMVPPPPAPSSRCQGCARSGPASPVHCGWSTSSSSASKLSADLVAQLLEPLARFGLFFFDVVGQADRQAWALHWGSSFWLRIRHSSRSRVM
jgi:hypothetical protein